MFINSLKKVAFSAILLIGVFSFSKNETSNSTLNLANINVMEELSNQKLECRPSSDYLFYVESDLVKKVRGASTVDAKVYIEEKSTGKKSLLTTKKVQVLKYDGAIAIDNHSDAEFTELPNGDKVFDDLEKSEYSFDELIKFDAVYSSYINSTSSLKN